MNDEQKLGVLTNTPVDVVLGGQAYKARRISARDLALMTDYMAQEEEAGRKASSQQNGIYFLIWRVLLDPKPASPEELAETISMQEVMNMATILEPLGFPKPQQTQNPVPPTGAPSTQE